MNTSIKNSLQSWEEPQEKLLQWLRWMVKPRQGSKFYLEISPFIHSAVHASFLYLQGGLDYAEMSETRSLPACSGGHVEMTFTLECGENNSRGLKRRWYRGGGREMSGNGMTQCGFLFLFLKYHWLRMH